MIDAGSLEFAHARIWARQGDAAGEALWRRIEVTRDFAAALEIARASPLARWLEGLGTDSGAHAVERVMRHHWHRQVAELASWMPRPWQAAVQWCGLLIDLPALQHLAAGAAPPPWMVDDVHWQALLADGLAAGDARQPLWAAARSDAQALLPRWRAEWSRRLPRGHGRAMLDAQVVPLLAAHAAAFAAPQAGDAWALRRALQQRLVLLLRRALLEPAAAFIHLALCALEFERLRGELSRRLVFATGPQGHAAP